MSSARAACRAVARRVPVPAFDVLCHFDAGDTDISADATAVVTWRDRGTQRQNLTNGTAGERPTYRRHGLRGYRSVRGDGTDDRLFNTSAAPFNGRSKASMLAILSGTAITSFRFLSGQAKTTAGVNGQHLYYDNGAGMVMAQWTSNTDQTAQGSTMTATGMPVWGTSQYPGAIETSCDLNAGHEVLTIGSGAGMTYSVMGGTSIDAAAGQLCLFAFSSSYSDAAAVDYHEVVLLARPLSAGERRRWFRRAQRRWGTRCRPDGPWRDGTFSGVA